MDDLLENYNVYKKANDLFDKVMDDTDILIEDIRGSVIAKQLTGSAGSIAANFEEGYGRGYNKEFIRFLRISRGSARETKGWYRRSKKFLTKELIDARTNDINEIIAMLASLIKSIDKSLNE